MPLDKKARLQKLIEALGSLPPMEAKLMEVCGSHTMAIARSGLKSLLPEGASLVSGPGCPVCVTPGQIIDAALELSMERDVLTASYGDMLRVPGSRLGDSLSRRRALGARVEIVYSPADAVELAAQNPGKETVFLGVGFETSAPGTAAAILTAKERGIKNFSVLSMLKRVGPALRALAESPEFEMQGLLCPGHVATVTGAESFRFLPEDYGLPAVIGGFEGEEILLALYLLLKQISRGERRLQNAYERAVRPEGNPLAMKMLESCFAPADDEWRGLGTIKGGGLRIRDELSAFDAIKKFGIVFGPAKEPPGCRCGQVIQGKLSPEDCPLFGRRCLPEEPVGPCMVSSEGACAAAYKYQRVE